MPTDPGSDPGSEQMLKLAVQVSSLGEKVQSLGAGVSEIKQAFKDLSERLEIKTQSKATNWIGIVTATVAILGVFTVFLGWMFSNNIEPVRKDLDSLKQKMTSENQAMELRLNQRIDSGAREIDAFKRDINRETQWNYANSNLRHESTQKWLDRLWQKVFGQEAPAYQPLAKP